MTRILADDVSDRDHEDLAHVERESWAGTCLVEVRRREGLGQDRSDVLGRADRAG